MANNDKPVDLPDINEANALNNRTSTPPSLASEASRTSAPMPPAPEPKKGDILPVALAPETAEDPSRSAPPAKAQKVGIIGYPKAKYHPVYGLRMVEDPNDEAVLPVPRNWFDTAEEADMHRTDREAQQVIHHNRSVKVSAALLAAENDGDHGLTPETVMGDVGVVRNSVAATESVKSGRAEPL